VAKSCRQADGARRARLIVDPLDGTTNFLHGYPQSRSAIGLPGRRQARGGGDTRRPASAPTARFVAAVRSGRTRLSVWRPTDPRLRAHRHRVPSSRSTCCTCTWPASRGDRRASGGDGPARRRSTWRRRRGELDASGSCSSHVGHRRGHIVIREAAHRDAARRRVGRTEQ